MSLSGSKRDVNIQTLRVINAARLKRYMNKHILTAIILCVRFQKAFPNL